MNNVNLEKRLGAKIAYLRKTKRYSQEKLAEKSDISLVYIGDIERGDANPTLDKLKALANALEVEVMELFNFYFLIFFILVKILI